MGGNVWEWVEDLWITAPPDRVLRGAAFSISANLLASSRFHHNSGVRHNVIGFRCVMVPGSTP